MAKGGDFEREICKKLSAWWTYDDRDDVFWRSSQSGGRATVRFRKGKRTAGSYGDITALDPIGEPLMQLFTIELKRGQKHGEPGNLIDGTGDINCHPFLNAVRQAREAHKVAGSRSWLLISKRDFYKPCVFFPSSLLSSVLTPFREALVKSPVFRYRVAGEDFSGVTLEKFLACVDPADLATVPAP